MDTNKSTNQPIHPPVETPDQSVKSSTITPLSSPPTSPSSPSSPLTPSIGSPKPETFGKPSKPIKNTKRISSNKSRVVKLAFIISGVIAFIVIASGVIYLKQLKSIEIKETPAKKISSNLIPLAEKNLKLGPGEKKEVIEWKKVSQLTIFPSQAQRANIAKQTLDWLNEQRDSRDVYIYGYYCSTEKGCNKQIADNRAGLAAIWGRFKHYQTTKDKNDLSIIDKDIDLYSNENIVGSIQNNFWNCKLMYEMWQSNLFSEPQKEKIEKICERSSYLPSELMEINKQIEEGKIEETDFKKLIYERPFATTNFQNYSSKGAKLIKYSSFTSDFIAKYLWKKDEKDLIRARLYFDKGINLWSQESQGSYLAGKCVLGIAALDLYEATGTTDYLDFANLFFEKEKIKDICLASPEEGANYCYNSLFEQTTCGIFVNKLASLSEKEELQELKENLITNLINNLFNYPEYKDGKEGKGSFYSISSGKEIFLKSTRENGLAVGLLMME